MDYETFRQFQAMASWLESSKLSSKFPDWFIADAKEFLAINLYGASRLNQFAA